MPTVSSAPRLARRIAVRGIVQGVGFRPFVFRLAREHGLAGWVLNGADGVSIHVEGTEAAVCAFIAGLRGQPPPAARIAAITVEPDDVSALTGFVIRVSESDRRPTTRISPDLPVCDECLTEMLDGADPRYRYPYINCTNCGPRFSIVRALPYDRASTTMADWPLCTECASHYHDPDDRRFHAQPVACPRCGPGYRLVVDGAERVRDHAAMVCAARLLREGRLLALKGIGGYHLACDAANGDAVATLRHRKYRKEQAFAVMARDLAAASCIVDLSAAAIALLTSPVRPIVLAPARAPLAGIAPDNLDIGVMLPYAPVHHLLFASGAPDLVVMTSGNRSSEPIAYEDEDARRRLAGLADAFLIGERPIARRVDDSVVRSYGLGPMVLRRSRGLAPTAVAHLPGTSPILAVGGDLKSAVTLVVDGQAYVSQHIGDLAHLESRQAFAETIRDLLAMYEIASDAVTVAHDLHPEYASTRYAAAVGGRRVVPVQHHRAHVASVLAERGAFTRPVLGVALDGTGYGDDGTIWGGELFVGSMEEGFRRVAHLREASLVGGDAAARHPVQAAAGFLAQLGALPDLSQPPFCFPSRYQQACEVLRSGVRVFRTTSAGRLFDTVAALLGFTRPITFEGQAAMWLEHQARSAAADSATLPYCVGGNEIDWREILMAVIDARRRGGSTAVIARAFHRAFAGAVAAASRSIADEADVRTIVLSGGVMQNDVLQTDLRGALPARFELWTNRAVPPNDGGISLGQAAIAAFDADRGNTLMNAGHRR